MKNKFITWVKQATLAVKEILIFTMCYNVTNTQYGIVNDVVGFKAIYEVELLCPKNKKVVASIKATTYKNAINKAKDEYFAHEVRNIHFVKITDILRLTITPQ